MSTSVQVNMEPAGMILLRMQNADGSVHRVSLEPGCDVSARLAQANADLLRLGMPPLSGRDISDVAAFASVAWTPAIVAAYRAASRALSAH